MKRQFWKRFFIRASALVLFIGILISITDTSRAQKRKAVSKKKSVTVEEAAKASMPSLLPTREFAPGSVGSYFYPRGVGSRWTLRTISSYFTSQITSVGTEERLLASDTAYVTEEIVANNRSSLQLLPIIICRDSVYQSRSGRSEEQEAQYYVDDSVIMVVFNNSILNEENRVILMTPLTEGYTWSEKQGDSILTAIEGLAEHVVTPAVTSDSAIVTRTFHRGTVLSKYFVQGYGLVRSEYHAPGREPGQRIRVETELIAIEPHNVGVGQTENRTSER